jgi:hypothetical protein
MDVATLAPMVGVVAAAALLSGLVLARGTR